MKEDETGESLLQQSDEIRSHFGSRHQGSRLAETFALNADIQQILSLINER